MKYLKILLVLAVLSSCSDRQTKCYSCNQSQREKISEFISSNIKGANNMSDEEMEDVIRELHNTGIKLYCNQRFVPANWDNKPYYNRIKKDSTETLFFYIY